MNARFGWALAAAAFAAGYLAWGWRGLVVVFSAVVFWLLLQFARSLRVLQRAGSAPVGRVDSAVMLRSQLNKGMTLMQVVALTRSLGTRLGDSPERWGWADDGGVRLELAFERARLVSWTLQREAPTAGGGEAAPP